MRSKRAKTSARAHNKNRIPFVPLALHDCERTAAKSERIKRADGSGYDRPAQFNIGSSACKGVVNSLARDIAT